MVLGPTLGKGSRILYSAVHTTALSTHGLTHPRAKDSGASLPMCTHWVRSWPHSAHRPFMTTGWLHPSNLTRSALQDRGKHEQMHV